jgi:phosphoribosylformimino-5-aminoimidazole carboxamide ribotide isomerase
MAVIENLFAAGVQRAVLGTSAVNDPSFTGEALKRYGDRIAIGIDARDGIARVSGWTETSQIGAIDLARKLEQEGARIVIYTDISRDGVLVGPNTESLKQMIDGTGLNVIASGGVSKLEDVRTLAAIRHSRLDGVIIGKALYEQLLTLEEVLKVSSC